MIYLRAFKLSERKIPNTNVYPYNIFTKKECDWLVFEPISILYGNNASGKSTLLNIIANKLKMTGAECGADINPWFQIFLEECDFTLGEKENGKPLFDLPKHSRYIKSEDVMYVVKKIQQAMILKESYLFQKASEGMEEDAVKRFANSYELKKKMDIMLFNQEKYSNGETTLQVLEDSIYPDCLYLLDEPEMSLSPQNQVLLAEKINEATRYLSCQFIVATHSPFMLGTLQGKIFNLDSKELSVSRWSDLENVRYFYDFFKKNEEAFK
ncbi:AAA family ATPase [Clostridium aminobutyricum]|uniref:AAA family ATPase n=1 Tax=Clostridium aminobutyricum TaxID=33953 RepID=A0A939D840_CLOAM|nr:AAA family ATPase [Clostridium aminobutyricum]MBN7772967.1 AAA family ATPase [Clostridium aminobutyricum]